MKGRIITGRAVITQDMINAGLIQEKPNLPMHDPKSRYWRQHKQKTKKQYIFTHEIISTKPKRSFLG